MRISVVFITDDKTKAEITIEPSWLARVFGARARRGVALKLMVDGYRARKDWFWETTGRQVDTDFSGRAITRALETMPIEELPPAKARSA
jgi:hypothetical protein